MAVAPNASGLFIPSQNYRRLSPSRLPLISSSRPKSLIAMASLSIAPTLGISNTFSRLKEQGKVRHFFIFFVELILLIRRWSLFP